MIYRMMTGALLGLLVLGAGCERRGEATEDAGAADKVQAASPPAVRPPLEVVVSPKTPMTGQVVVFSLDLPPPWPPLARLEATFGGRRAVPARWDREGRRWRVLSSVPTDPDAPVQELRLEGALADGAPLLLERRLTVQETPYEERHIRVSRRYMKPSGAQRRRAKRESDDLARVLAQPADERLWRGSFLRPTDTRVTSPFGTLRTYNTRKRKSRHLGLDLDGDTGDPIRAAQRGRVALVQERFYSGGTVVLDHGHGLFTLYFHMSAFDVDEGALVDKGALLGKVGSTGRVTGPHLHFSVKMGGVYVDPAQVLALSLDDDPRVPPAPEDPAGPGDAVARE